MGGFRLKLRRRAAVEHAVAKVKAWRIISRERGRYRYPIGKYKSILAAVT